MAALLSILIGFLFACGVYCILRRSIVRLAIGIILLAQGANLLLFTSAGLTARRPALIADGQTVLTAPFADPLPQALILTAIVIGFGFVAFLLALIYRSYADLGSDDINDFNRTDQS